ncbi:MAG: ABC transporter substrate-binding protein [Pseudanabaenaceae cyanobacterium SKYGB_i_bin29]|nr:ABC transporter substrate-binding protein [Pseudanabaenaceae cyanobacterium SKYG29]MDW8422083.1 ABC transporter substrate-binding protein [Pseudanabaenaceae cyanobacterium SKYGB_i_bin29]
MLLLEGCGVNRVARQQIVVGTTSQVRTLDPADAYEFFAGNVLAYVTDRLYTYSADSPAVVPQLAADFPQVSPDGLVYRIPLRRGVKFHDGTDFNSGAMAFSLRRFMAKGGAPSFLLQDVIDRLETPDLYTLVIHLKTPVPFFLKLLAFPGAGAVSPQFYQQQQEFVADRVIGTGPYVLTEYKPGQVLRLRPFANYWGEKVKNQGIDIQFFSSSANLLNAFKTGAVDVAWQTLSPYQIQNLQRQAARQQWQVVEGESATILYMSLNVTQPPLDDVRVRRALALAIDRELIADRVFMGQRAPLYSLLPTTLPESRPVFYRDVQQAKELLRQAGYSPDRPARISLWYSPRYGGNGDLIATTLKAALARDLGGMLRLELEPVEPTTAYALIEAKVYPAFLFDWVPDILDSDNFLQPFLTCERQENNICVEGSSAFQGSFFFEPELNVLVKQQRQVQDTDKRREIIDRIQTLTAEYVPFIPLWQNREYVFSHSYIRGVRLNSNQLLDLSSMITD